MGHLYTLGKSLEIPRFVMTLKYTKGQPFYVTLRDQMMNMRHSDGSDILVDLENSNMKDVTKKVLDDMIVMVDDKLIEMNRQERNICLGMGIYYNRDSIPLLAIESTKAIAEKYDIPCSTTPTWTVEFVDKSGIEALNKLMVLLG